MIIYCFLMLIHSILDLSRCFTDISSWAFLTLNFINNMLENVTTDANFPDQNVQRHNVKSLETARSLAYGTIVAGGGGGGLGGGIPQQLQRLLSLIGFGSTGEVCGQSLTAGKILFAGRQTCSLYLVLWLCEWNPGVAYSKN